MKYSNQDNELAERAKSSDSFIYPLRVIAFITVFVSHGVIAELNGLPGDPNKNINVIAKFMSYFYQSGAAGVAIFFLVSGFVITKAAIRETWRTFAARRVFRILPMYFLALFVFWMIQSIFQNKSIPSFKLVVASLSLLGDFVGAPNQLIGVDWTLRIEVIFYLFIALGLVLSAILRERRRVRVTFVLFGVLAIIVPFIPFFPTGGWAGGYAAIFGPLFLGGMSVALHSLRLISVPTLLSFLTLAYLSSTTAQTDFRPDADYGPFLLWAYGIFIAAYYFYPKRQVNSIIVWLSGLTYSIYLFHAFLFGHILTLINGILIELRLEEFGNQLFLGLMKIESLLTLAIFLGIMHLLVKKVEKPIIQWSRAKFSD